MARLSVAVRPPPEVVALLSALDRPALPGVRWSLPEQWLVKLRPLGQVDERVVPALRDALEAELDGAPAIACRLGPLTRRLGGQWLGAPVHGLDELAAVVFEATQELVPVTHPQPFQADLVLARGRVPRDLAGRPVAGSWTARSVALLADRSSPQAVRFQELASFPLEDPGPA
jgi:2'-5' RNA ligase